MRSAQGQFLFQTPITTLAYLHFYSLRYTIHNIVKYIHFWRWLGVGGIFVKVVLRRLMFFLFLFKKLLSKFKKNFSNYF